MQEINPEQVASMMDSENDMRVMVIQSPQDVMNNYSGGRR